MAIKKKHMWLEAKLPSEPDWIPLDPSFKLYGYVAGLESQLSLTSTSNILNEYFYESEFLSDVMSLDISQKTIFAVETAGDREEKAFMLSTGMLGSCLEHEIFEPLYNKSVSTMKILELANNRDIRIRDAGYDAGGGLEPEDGTNHT
jgi:hypothetical protein